MNHCLAFAALHFLSLLLFTTFNLPPPSRQGSGFGHVLANLVVLLAALNGVIFNGTFYSYGALPTIYKILGLMSPGLWVPISLMKYLIQTSNVLTGANCPLPLQLPEQLAEVLCTPEFVSV